MNDRNLAILAIGIVAVGSVAMLSMSGLHSPQSEGRYQSTIACNDGLKSFIVAEHVDITIKGSIYFLQRKDGHVMTYEKDSMAWCATMLDADVIKP